MAACGNNVNIICELTQTYLAYHEIPQYSAQTFTGGHDMSTRAATAAQRKTKLLRLKALNSKIEGGKATRQEVLEAIDIRRWAKADREAAEREAAEHARNFKPRIAWTTGGSRGRGVDGFTMGMARVVGRSK
jgi:hypothetical protein